MSVEQIEIGLIGLVSLLQLGFFVYTYNKINLLKKIIPNSDSFKITKIHVYSKLLNSLSPTELLENIDEMRGPNNLEDISLVDDIEGNDKSDLFNSSTVEISIVESNFYGNIILERIIKSINTYLIRNRSSASDFNLIKDIVERNTDSVEEEIDLTISTPLYLGLTATMLGIVIGLLFMSDFSVDVSDIKESNEVANTLVNKKIGDNISILLGGVKLAMIASLFGLFLVILNSSIFFRMARRVIDLRKNDFYSFIQIELLPVLNQGLGSTFESLQRNLLKFNSELSTNLKGLSGIFNANKEALKSQQEILTKLENIPVAEIAKYNIKVMHELQNSTSNIKQFNHYLNNVNSFVGNSNKLVEQSNDLLSRTENFKTIAENVEARLTESEKLMKFLSNHYEKLEEYKDYVSSSVVDVGNSISDTFDELKEHIQGSTDAVKTFTIDELEILKNALSESKTNLSNLEHLASINKNLSKFEGSSKSQSEEVRLNLVELNDNIRKSTRYLELLESTTLTHKTKTMKQSIGKLFGRK